VPVAVLESVNLGRARPNPYKRSRARDRQGAGRTGPSRSAIPGPKRRRARQRLVGDFIGDRKHHGGDEQAVYAFQREDLDRWAERLGRQLPNGFFGRT
jgi:MOSC domain-containing protein YiiM